MMNADIKKSHFDHNNQRYQRSIKTKHNRTQVTQIDMMNADIKKSYFDHNNQRYQRSIKTQHFPIPPQITIRDKPSKKQSIRF